MANSLEDATQGRLQNKTHLIQLYTDDPEDAPRLISQAHPDGVPLMVMVDSPAWYFCKLNIPNGVYTLQSFYGKHTGIMQPGCYCCYCTCCNMREVNVLITKNTIRFNCPIEKVPTKDDVMVSLDVGINFHIGRSPETEEEDVAKFFYNFGPNRLEELLQEECDEGIRDFVRKIKVARIRDVKSELTVELLESLKEKFAIYGVFIE
jgi:hypothetical protein